MSTEISELNFVNANTCKPLFVACKRYGYSGFDNNGGGRWFRAIFFPISKGTLQTSYYEIEIDTEKISIKNAIGDEKCSINLANEFWPFVKEDGTDIRICDTSYKQFQFQIKEWNYGSYAKIAFILEREINGLYLVYNNPNAEESSYQIDDLDVFQLGEWDILFYDGFEEDEVGTRPSNWIITNHGSSTLPEVVDTITYIGTKSCKSYQANTGSPSHFHMVYDMGIAPLKLKIRLAFYIEKKLNSGSANSFSFNIMDQPYDGTRALLVNVYNKAAGIWHVLEIEVDFDKQQYRYIIDDVATDWLSFLNPMTPSEGRYFEHYNDNWGGYFDEVYLLIPADAFAFGTPQLVMLSEYV